MEIEKMKNFAYVVYNMKDKDFYIMDKNTYDKMYFQKKARYVIIFDVEYDGDKINNMKLPRPPYGLEECSTIVKELLGE